MALNVSQLRNSDSPIRVHFTLSDLPPTLAELVDIDPESGCWVPDLPYDRDGYSRLGDKGAHRAVWELLVGPIEPGLVLDHVRRRGCVWNACIWPGHLEPVTTRTNVLRGRSFAAVNAAKDRCDNGHEFDMFNTYYWHGRRDCRICIRVRVARYKKRQRAALVQGSLTAAA